MKVLVQGVPAYGLIDSGADITIIGGLLFKRVATIARLKLRNFKPADKVPRTYDQQPFRLDGRMDLDITFGDRKMTTPIYIKMDAHDQLLLSEGVCRQLGILHYHPDVETWRGGHRKSKQPARHQSTVSAPQSSSPCADNPAAELVNLLPTSEAKVPTVHVSLVQSIQLLPHQSQAVEVALTGTLDKNDSTTYLLEPTDLQCGLEVEPSLITVSADGDAVVAIIANQNAAEVDADVGDPSV